MEQGPMPFNGCWRTAAASIVAASRPFAERKRLACTQNQFSQEWMYGHDFTAQVTRNPAILRAPCCNAGTAYSYLSDSIGSTRIARRVGK
jgi:hypothetical protein